MVINWTDTAKLRLHEIFYYYENEASRKKALEIIAEITLSVTRLENFPESAAIESLLIKRTKTYRSLIVLKIFKVIYYIENEVINITEIWDCRQAPETNVKKIKE